MNGVLLPSALASLAAMPGPGSRLYLGGGIAEPTALLDLVAANPDIWRDVTLTGPFIPGLNTRDLTKLGIGTRVEIVTPTPALGAADPAVSLYPIPYTAFERRLGLDAPVDFAFFAVPPPRRDGTVGLGPGVDFVPAVAGSAARLIGLVNDALPDAINGVRLPASRFHALVEAPSPLPEMAAQQPDATSLAIAARVATLIRPGDTIQIGIGRLPSAVLAALTGHRDLGYHGGMVSPPLLPLIEAGVFSRGITAGVSLGDAAFVASVAARRDIRFAPVSITHGAAKLASIERFVAINGALEVDLLGQVNVEWAGSRRIAAVAGLPDFLHGARASLGGRSIVALPATGSDGHASRIVRRLATPVSVPRSDVDFVVTQYGIADLRLADERQRAIRLAAVAAPEHREKLAEEGPAPLSPVAPAASPQTVGSS